MLRLTTLLAGLVLSLNAFALSIADLSQGDASGGLKDALSQGAKIAVQQLGKPGGFSNDPDVRIGLPGNLGKIASTMKMMGMGNQVEQLEATMNQAAEAAVPHAQALLLDAVKKMTISDAKGILGGPQDAATQYLNRTSREQIRAKFLPIVKQATDQVGLARLRRQGRQLRRDRRQERQPRRLRGRAGARRPVRSDRPAGSQHPREPGRCRHQPGQEGVRHAVSNPATGTDRRLRLFTFNSHAARHYRPS